VRSQPTDSTRSGWAPCACRHWLVTGSDTASPQLRQAIESLQASLPNPTLVVLEGQQHNAMDSARQKLAEAIMSFLL